MEIETEPFSDGVCKN